MVISLHLYHKLCLCHCLSIYISSMPFNYAKCVCVCECFDANFHSEPENLKWCFLFRQKSNELVVTLFLSSLIKTISIAQCSRVCVCVSLLYCVVLCCVISKTFTKRGANQPYLTHTHPLSLNKRRNKKREREKVSTSKCVCVSVHTFEVL